MPLTQGQHFNERYWIAELIERGGFGAVYKAWDITLNRPVAIKESYEDTAEGQRQFLHEAQLLANLAHPNLPRVIDFFAITGQGQYLVMEFVDGQTLEELRVLNGGTLPEGRTLVWIVQVLEALSYIHGQEPPIIHRDIKPLNIKITPADKVYPQGRAMLVDFGVAKAYDPHKRTTVGARAVTPGFSPHEQYGQSGTTTDARTDIYSLGATLYMLLTGQEPPESVARLFNDQLAPPRKLNPALSRQIEMIIQKAMNNNPALRFQTAEELIAAISGLLPAASPPPAAVSPERPGVPTPPGAGGQQYPASPPPVVVIEPPATAPAKAAAQAAPAPSPQLAHQPGSPPAQPAAQPGAQAPARAQLQVQASATCPSCTAPLEAGTMFCRYCGTPVRPARADALPASPRAQQPGGAPRPRKNAKADAGKPPKVWVTIGLVIIGYGIGWLVSWIPGMSSDDYFSIGGALGGLVFGVALWKAGILRHWAYAILPGFFWSLSSAIGYFEGWVLGGIVLGVVFGIVTGVQLLIRIGKRS